MTTFPLLKGTKLRITKTNSCGVPIAGPANRLVTSGFVQVTAAAEMRDAQNIEQTNAEGKVCVSDRTPPERKWYNVDLELCNVNVDVISLLTGTPTVLDYNDVPVGFRDQPNVDDEYGAALEVWTAGRSDDDCPVPTTDAGLGSPGSGRSYGYFLFGGKEWRISSDLVVQSDVTTVTVSGITIPMTGWGVGPYNVVERSAGVAGRLLDPFTKDPHYHLERTKVPPPAETPGAVPLAVTSVFTGVNYYYGGPAGEPPVTTAPAQPVNS